MKRNGAKRKSSEVLMRVLVSYIAGYFIYIFLFFGIHMWSSGMYWSPWRDPITDRAVASLLSRAIAPFGVTALGAFCNVSIEAADVFLLLALRSRRRPAFQPTPNP
jgi:polyferredoxin